MLWSFKLWDTKLFAKKSVQIGQSMWLLLLHNFIKTADGPPITLNVKAYYSYRSKLIGG